MITRSLGMLVAASALVVLVGCTPATDPAVDTGTGTDSGTTTEDTTEAPAGDLITLSGTGEYVTGESIPIGGYQLTGEPTEQPSGCTWTLYLENGEVFTENGGSYVFITDVTGRFVTDGCPDWQQFE